MLSVLRIPIIVFSFIFCPLIVEITFLRSLSSKKTSTSPTRIEINDLFFYHLMKNGMLFSIDVNYDDYSSKICCISCINNFY